MKLFLDLETFSATPLKQGIYKYAEHAEIMLFAFAIDDEPTQVWDCTAGPEMTATEVRLRQALQSSRLIAHNVQFDRTVLRARGYDLPIHRWHCTMAQAYAHSLPGALDKLCEILNVPQDQRKQKIGKQLVQLFCKPRGKTSKIRRATRETHPAEWAQFKEYAKQDVEAMRAVYHKLPTWNYCDDELALWHLDQRINDRGISVDVDLATSALRTVLEARGGFADRVNSITNGDVVSATKRDALLVHLLREYGVDLPDLQASTLERRLGDPDVPEPVRELLRIRLQASMTSTTKYKTLLDSVGSDGRLRGLLQFCGASRTGRWAGRVFQPQNLARVPKHLSKEIDNAIELIKNDCADLAYENVMEVLSACIRGCLVANEGKQLAVADLSNIEGRFAAWIAGEEWKIKAFREYDSGAGHDLYVLAYARSFGVDPDEVLADYEAGGIMRQIGKVQELALQFQGAVGAFGTMAKAYGVDLPDDQVLRIVKAWRKAHPRIVSFWYELEEAAEQAIMNPGVTIERRRLKLRRDGNWLRIKLPSCRCLCYPSPRMVEGKITYMGVNQYTRKWERITTYGGKLFENAVQGGARDVIAYNMPTIELAGFEILLTVHDEVITEADLEHKSDNLCDLLALQPQWAPGLPLAASGFETQRYRKG